MAYVKESFKELDIMSNYMFNKLTTRKETADKFCRILLRELIGRDLGKITIKAESILPPDNPEKRGVRLDVKIDEYSDKESIASVYDVEPHRKEETDYPKRIRFRQAQLDKDSMESGDDNFNHMPELYIIYITNYDPFGYDEMVYTIENRCLEVPEFEYNDGVKIYYFNTTGTKGGSAELKIFLNYLEESTSVNAVNEVTKEVAKFVEFLKDDKTIEGDYMTVGEWVDGMVQDGIAEGLEKGLQQGIEKGIQQGIQQGIEQGIAQGIAQGIQQGIEQGVEYNLIGQIKKKILKNKQLPQIADELEVEIDDIKNIYETVVANQDKTPEEIYKILNHKE